MRKIGELRWDDSNKKTEIYVDVPGAKTLYFEQLTQAFLVFSATDNADDPKSVQVSVMSDLEIGMSQEFEVAIPNWKNKVTMSFEILNPAGKTIYSHTGIARNQDPLVILVERPLYPKSSIRCILASAPGGTGGNVLIDGTVLRNSS